MAAKGKSRITHTDTLWLNDSMMRLLTDPPVGFSNKYEMEVVMMKVSNGEIGEWLTPNQATELVGTILHGLYQNGPDRTCCLLEGLSGLG